MAVNEIRYKGVSYATDDDIKVPSGILYEVKALRSDSLEANSLTVTVFSNDKAIMGFAKNDKVEYFRDGRRVGVYYLQTVERVGSDAYTLSALSALGRLITMRHAGGIYTGQTVAEVVPQICAPVAANCTATCHTATRTKKKATAAAPGITSLRSCLLSGRLWGPMKTASCGWRSCGTASLPRSRRTRSTRTPAPPCTRPR